MICQLLTKYKFSLEEFIKRLSGTPWRVSLNKNTQFGPTSDAQLSANGGFLMSASHNPGGSDYDWGIKFNNSSGQAAPESITDEIYGNTLSVCLILALLLCMSFC